MGFLNRLKTFVGAHGASTKLFSLNDTFPDETELRLTRTSLTVQFDVNTDQDVRIIGHHTSLRVGVLEGETPTEAIVAEASEVVDYELAAGESRRVVLDLSFDLWKALRDLGVDPEDAVQNDAIRWAVTATADVKGTALDASCRQDLRLEGVEEQWMTGDGWESEPGAPEGQLYLQTPDQGLGARDCFVPRIELRRLDDETVQWVLTPADGKGEVTLTLPLQSDLHYSEQETEVLVTERGDEVLTELTVGYRYRGWIIVSYRVRGVLRGYFNGDLSTLDGGAGALYGRFEATLPD